MIRNPFTREFWGAPLWSWFLGLAPWAWVIPLNQYFWDDWIFQNERSFNWHFDYWVTVGAKHYLNPVLFPPLLALGAWSFHLVMCVALVVGARSLSQITATIPGLQNSVAQWSGPMFLAMPLFHARFSVATLEYTLALCCLLVGWAVMLSMKLQFRRTIAFAFLTYAVGVPTLAPLFLVVWIHGSLSVLTERSRTNIHMTLRRHIFVPMIPIVFALVYQTGQNTRGKYRLSPIAIIEATRFGGILLIAALIALFAHRRKGFRQNPIRVARYVTLGLLSIALLPYFAVGYNPMSDFLPWRIRAEVAASLWSRLPMACFILLGTTALLFLVSHWRIRRSRTASFLVCSTSFIAGMLHFHVGLIDWDTRLPYIVWPITAVCMFALLVAAIGRFAGGPLLGAVWAKVCILSLFGATMVSFGPMDWESRHWLVAWPVLTVMVILLMSSSNVFSVTLVRATFVVLVASSIAISSEYFVDVLKQRAIIDEAGKQLSSFISDDLKDSADVVIVVYQKPASNELNARFREYRPYEWWGLLAEGLRIPNSRVRVLAPKDVEATAVENCVPSVEAIAIKPMVYSARREALTRFKVRVDLDPNLLDVCDVEPTDGWPRRNS